MSHNYEILRKEALERRQRDQRAVRKRGKNRVRNFSPDLEIRNLVSSVFLAPAGNTGAKTVLFCPTEEMTRCAWICARTAETLATQTRASVCAVDGNFQSSSLHEQFGQISAAGFRDAMQSKDSATEFVTSTWISNLSLLGAGHTDGNFCKVLDPVQVGRVLNDLQKRFDYVLITAPPVGLYADALCIGCFVDGAVLVMTANLTRREVARMAKERLESARVRVLGAILDGRTYPIPEVIYRRL